MPGWVQFVTLRLPCAYLLKKLPGQISVRTPESGLALTTLSIIHLAELLFLRPG